MSWFKFFEDLVGHAPDHIVEDAGSATAIYDPNSPAAQDSVDKVGITLTHDYHAFHTEEGFYGVHAWRVDPTHHTKH